MPSDPSFPLSPLKTLLWRGWRKKCPQCGRGALYQRWLKLHDRCSDCGLRYLANQGDLLGPLLFFDRVLFLIPLITLFYFHVWHPDLVIFLILGGAMLYLLIATMPNRNGVSLAFDYYMRRTHGDLADKPAADPEEK